MGYFPFFMDLEGREGLVVGGGAVALRKLQKLLPYGPRLTVAAPELLAEIEALPGLTRLRRSFAPAMLEGKGFVIAATDDREVNRGIAALCRERGIPVNAVDDKEQCTFLFPALVKRGYLTVGVSTAGASPSAAAWVGRSVCRRTSGSCWTTWPPCVPWSENGWRRKTAPPCLPGCFRLVWKRASP